MEDDLDINDIKLSEKTEDDNEEEKKEEEEEEEEDENSEGREYSYVRGRCRPSVRTREASTSPDPNEEKNENEDEEYMYDSDPDYANLFQDIDDNVDQGQDYMNVNQPIKLRDHRRSASVGNGNKDGLKVKRISRPLSNYLNVAPLPEPVLQVEDATKTTGQSTVNTTTSEQSEEDSPKSSAHRIKPKYRAPARPPPGFKKLPPVDTSLGDVTAMKKSVSSHGTGLTRNRPALKKTVSVPHTSSEQKTSAPSKPPRARPNPSSEQLQSHSSPLLSTSQNYQLSEQRKKSTGELQKPDNKTSSTRQTSHPIPSKKVPPPSVVTRKPPEHRKTTDVPRKKKDPTPPSTKKDLTPRSTKKDLTPRSTKKDLTPPSTKKDLTPPSTKKDLTPPSTKKDLTPPSTKKDLTPPSTKKSSEPELLNQIKQGDTPKSSPSSGRKAVRVAPPPPKPLSSPLLREGPQEGKIGDEKVKVVSEEKPELPPPPLPPKGVSVSEDDAIDKSKVVSKQKRRNEQHEETRDEEKRDEDKETNIDSVVSENAMKVLNAMKQTVTNVKSVSATLSEV